MHTRSIGLVGTGLAAALLAGCSSAPPLVGRWTGENAAGYRMAFVFRGDGTAAWIVTGADVADSLEIRYEFDRSAEPHHLDLTGFEHGPLAGVTMYGILEFVDNDTFRLSLEPGPPGEEGAAARPAEFTDEAVSFARVARPR